MGMEGDEGGAGWVATVTSLHRYIVTSLHRYIVTSLHRYIVTSLHRYIVTMLHRYIVTMLQSYSVIVMEEWSPLSLRDSARQVMVETKRSIFRRIFKDYSTMIVPPRMKTRLGKPSRSMSP